MKEKFKHHHQFKEKAIDQIASWSKRINGQDAIYFRGIVKKCIHCHLLRFQPANSNLKETDIVSCPECGGTETIILYGLYGVDWKCKNCGVQCSQKRELEI